MISMFEVIFQEGPTGTLIWRGPAHVVGEDSIEMTRIPYAIELREGDTWAMSDARFTTPRMPVIGTGGGTNRIHAMGALILVGGMTRRVLAVMQSSDPPCAWERMLEELARAERERFARLLALGAIVSD